MKKFSKTACDKNSTAIRRATARAKNPTIKYLSLLVTELEKYETGDWTSSNLEKNIIKFIADSGLKNGDVLWPMRVALTGEQKSPPPFEVAAILGQDKSLSRIKQAIDLLK